jgi:hypothetical protein
VCSLDYQFTGGKCIIKIKKNYKGKLKRAKYIEYFHDFPQFWKRKIQLSMRAKHFTSLSFCLKCYVLVTTDDRLGTNQNISVKQLQYGLKVTFLL